MSSRFTPPNTGDMAFTIPIISCGSCVSKHSGKASTPPSSLKRTALPSITGIAPYAPMFPRPRTAEPSETTATMLPLTVSFLASDGSFARTLDASATPGV